jgi:hypothetical protein
MSLSYPAGPGRKNAGRHQPCATAPRASVWGTAPPRGTHPGRASGRLRGGGGLGSARRASGLVETAQRLTVGGDEAGLQVGHAQILAAAADHAPVPAQVRAGHAGEQVVLDLMVQAAGRDAGEPPATHVAGGEHLPAQEVGAVLAGEDGHALVTGGEDRSEADAGPDRTEEPAPWTRGRDRS